MTSLFLGQVTNPTGLLASTKLSFFYTGPEAEIEARVAETLELVGTVYSMAIEGGASEARARVLSQEWVSGISLRFFFLPRLHE